MMTEPKARGCAVARSLKLASWGSVRELVVLVAADSLDRVPCSGLLGAVVSGVAS